MQEGAPLYVPASDHVDRRTPEDNGNPLHVEQAVWACTDRTRALLTCLLRDMQQSSLKRAGWVFDPQRIGEIVQASGRAGFTGVEIAGGQSYQIAIERGWPYFPMVRAASGAAQGSLDLQTLLRGKNLMGFRPYGADVCRLVIRLLAENGVTVIRNFDALNDLRNMQLPPPEGDEAYASALQRLHLQGAMCFVHYPQVPHRYTDDYYVNYGNTLVNDLGYHSLAIKDMAGQITEERVRTLVPRLREEVRGRRGRPVPLTLHVHSTNFEQSKAAIAAALEEGIYGIELAVAPLAGGPSHHDARLVLQEPGWAERVTPLCPEGLRELERLMRESFPPEHQQNGALDQEALRAFCSLGLPGGAVPFILSDIEKYVVPTLQKREGLSSEGAWRRAMQLFQQELAVVSADAGYPPLVTPVSWIVYVQAIMNCNTGSRYKYPTPEFARFILGGYGDLVDHATGQRASVNPDLLQPCRQRVKGSVGHPSAHVPLEMDKHYESADALTADLGEVASNFGSRDENALAYALQPVSTRDLVREACIAHSQRNPSLRE